MVREQAGDRPRPTRRRLLEASAALLLTSAAGCGSGADGATDTDTPAAATSRTDASTRTATPTPTPGETTAATTTRPPQDLSVPADMGPTADLLGADAASNADRPIVAENPPSEVTHRLTSRGATIGISDLGGGYVNHFDFGDRVNVVESRFGRGWQSSLRDRLHRSRHNPTQAGSVDLRGAPVTVRGPTDTADGGRRLVIPRFNLPLFQDPVFDFTEHEDLYDDHWDRDGDNDGIDESGLSQGDELRSEFDFGGFYEDVAPRIGAAVPVFRHVFAYEYRRDPGPAYHGDESPEKYSPMQQFGERARMEGRDGPEELEPVIDERARTTDIAPGRDGEQPATNVDYSMGQATWGIRLRSLSGLTTFMWLADGEWQARDITEPGRGEVALAGVQHLDRFPDLKGRPRQMVSGPFDSEASLGVTLLANGTDPTSARALGVFTPGASPLNRTPVAGVDAETGEVRYREDRRVSRIVLANMRISQFPLMVERLFFTGLSAPRHAPKGIVERLTTDVYVIAGTPERIRGVAEAIDGAYRSG